MILGVRSQKSEVRSQESGVRSLLLTVHLYFHRWLISERLLSAMKI
ncbi:MAG: hypothetical protein AAFX80_23995 [Cyanobacteria bacterium J06639_18]